VTTADAVLANLRRALESAEAGRWRMAALWAGVAREGAEALAEARWGRRPAPAAPKGER
jgi:hypothetical protein